MGLEGSYDTVDQLLFKVNTTSGIVGLFFLRSWDHASLRYLSINNNMQCYTMVFITINALHELGDSSAHHQEPQTVYTASGVCRAFTASYCLHE